MEKQKGLRKLVDAIRQIPASELSFKVNERICSCTDGNFRERNIKGAFKGYPIYATYLPYHNENRDYKCRIRTEKGNYVLTDEASERVIKILERKYNEILSAEEERKIEKILGGKKRCIMSRGTWNH